MYICQVYGPLSADMPCTGADETSTIDICIHAYITQVLHLQVDS